MDILHVYAQPAWHDEAYIVGNRPALLALCGAIARVFNDKSDAHAEVMVNDGEGYHLHVRLIDADTYTDPRWSCMAVPYTDEYARERSSEAVWPE